MGKPKKNWDYLVDFEGNYVGGTGGGGAGPQGLPGVPGPAGAKGNTGATGAKGATGAVGPVATGAFIFKGNVPNAAALPTTGNAVGDSYVQQDVNELVVWDGTQWSGQGPANTTTLKGDKGATGQKGEVGVQGLKGAKGNLGPKGVKGDLPLISTLPQLP